MQQAFSLNYAGALQKLSEPGSERFVSLAERGQLVVELYQPHKEDLQQPHSRDECYVITEGSGQFVMGDETVPFKPGDFLFVAAGVPHKFIEFGESMTCWVIFYGPEGGEANQ